MSELCFFSKKRLLVKNSEKDYYLVWSKFK